MKYRVAEISKDRGHFAVLDPDDTHKVATFFGPEALERAQQYAIWLNDARPSFLSLAIAFVFGGLCSAIIVPFVFGALSCWRKQ